MIALIALQALAFLCGIAIGATLVRDLLDGLWSRPAQPARIPLASVLTRGESKLLELPAIKRRQRMPAIGS